MTTAINLSINEALTAAWDGCWMQTGHAQHRAVLLGQEICPQRQRPELKGVGAETELKGIGRRLLQPGGRWSGTQTMHRKRAKRRAWCSA